MALVPMRVERAGYWAGAYPQPGETIEVDAAHVAALEQAQFARRLDIPPSSRPPKGATHGTGKKTGR